MSWPETVRNASRPKKSSAKSTAPCSVLGRLWMSSVLTRNMSPAPSASLAVTIGVLTQKNPFLVKKSWIANAAAWRMRATAPNVLVRGRRCACSRRNSRLCCLGWIG